MNDRNFVIIYFMLTLVLREITEGWYSGAWALVSIWIAGHILWQEWKERRDGD